MNPTEHAHPALSDRTPIPRGITARTRQWSAHHRKDTVCGVSAGTSAIELETSRPLRASYVLQVGAPVFEDVRDCPVVSESTLESACVPDDVKRLRELERENQSLKRIVADQALDIQGLREISKGNF